LQSIGAPLVEAAGSAALFVAGAGGEEVPLDDPEEAAPLVDAAADLSTPPWWLQAPLPVLAEVVPSLQTTDAAVAEAAVSAAALPANGKANTPANKAPYTSAQELRIFMEISPLVYWKNWPAAQMGQPFSDISYVAAGKRRDFCRLPRGTSCVACPTSSLWGRSVTSRVGAMERAERCSAVR
jgi:hypothetical protein